jgi:hypothetical protein
MKKILATIAALVIAAVAFAAPAQASDSDVREALYIAKLAWSDLDYSDQSNLCDYWYLAPRAARNEIASVIKSESYFYITTYDSRRVAYRLLNWAC